jgi:hypothetical protein
LQTTSAEADDVHQAKALALKRAAAAIFATDVILSSISFRRPA